MVVKLLKKIGLLSIIILLSLMLLFAAFKVRMKEIKLADNLTTIICGDSHPQSGIDDSLLKNSLNICQMSEPYVGTYHVIKILTANNPQVNKIILGYSYHSLSKSEEDQFLQEDFSKFFYPRYLMILDPATVLNLSKSNFSNIIRTIPFILRGMLFPLFSSHLNSYPFVGHFYRSQNSNLNDSTINKAIQRHFIKESIPTEISSIQEQYLKAIVDYCYSKHIQLYLVNTPLDQEYEKKIPNKFKENYYSFYEKIKDHASLLDFHDLTLSSSYFGDGDHLNEKGAAVLTGKIDSLFSVFQGNLVPVKK